MPNAYLTLFAALDSQAAVPASLGGSEGPDMTRYLLVCSVLLLGIALLAFGFRRVVGRNLAAKASKRSLQIMDVLPLGGRQRLAVVRCYDRTFLLGMGEREVSLVTELDAVIAPAAAKLPPEADRRAFADLLERAGLAPGPERAPAPRPAEPAGASAPARRPAEPRPARVAREGAGWLG